MTHENDDRHFMVLLAMIKQAVMDATGRSFLYANSKDRHDARIWLARDLPSVWMPLVSENGMTEEDIKAMQKEMELWVRCGCPQDGKWWNRDGRQLGLWI